MAEQLPLASTACADCSQDVRACMDEGWRLVDGTDGCFALRFRCARLDVAIEAEHRGRGCWHVVDHGLAPGGIDVAVGRAAGVRAIMYHAADAFHALGHFAPLSRGAIAHALQRVYEAGASSRRPTR